MTVKVKPLVWDEYDRSEPLGLRYLLCDPSQSDDTNGWYVLEEVTNTAIESDGSPEAARAAAQADFDARIRAEIEAPDHLALVAAAYRDAAAWLLDMRAVDDDGNETTPEADVYVTLINSLPNRTPADAEAHLTALLRAEYERGKAETQQSAGTTIKETIIGVLRHYRQNEVGDEYGEGYPLVDALTLKGHSIDMGIREIENIADAVADALLPQEGR